MDVDLQILKHLAVLRTFFVIINCCEYFPQGTQYNIVITNKIKIHFSCLTQLTK